MRQAGDLDSQKGQREAAQTYSRLFSIEFANSYFNRPDVSGAKFSVKPTVRSSSLLKTRRLLARSSEGGIEIAYPDQQKEVLLEYLRADAADQKEWLDHKSQEWLSFTASPDGADFYQYTDLPFDFQPTDTCLYLSNAEPAKWDADRDAQLPWGQRGVRDNPVNLAPARFVTKQSALPKIGREVRLSFPPDCSAIRLLNVVGETVQSYPRQFPEGLLASSPLDQIDCRLADEYIKGHPDDKLVERTECIIHFHLEPAGKYTIHYVGSTKSNEEMIYPAGDAGCLCFVDIFLTKPEPDVAGVYPVLDLFGTGKTHIQYVNYAAEFETRMAYWNYIFMMPAGTGLVDPEFYDQNGNPVPFGAAKSVQDMSGADAISMRSTDGYLLQDKPVFWMELRGSIQARDGLISTKKVLVSALPTPDPSQLTILPDPNQESQSKKGREARSIDNNSNNISVANIYVYL
jgi:hypothetical protein